MANAFPKGKLGSEGIVFYIPLDNFPDDNRSREVVNRHLEAVSGVQSFTIQPKQKRAQLILPREATQEQAREACREVVNRLRQGRQLNNALAFGETLYDAK